MCPSEAAAVGMGRHGPDSREDIYSEVLRRLHTELGDEVSSILLTGSEYERSSDPDSDVDVCVLWKKRHSLRRRMVVRGVEVDLFYDEPGAIRRVFKVGQLRHVVWMYAHARVLHDPEGIGAQLMAEGTAAWDRGRSLPTKDQRFRQHCEIRDMLRTLERVREGEQLNFAYLVGPYVATAVEAYWSRHRQWGTHRKTALQSLRDSDPEVFALVDVVHDASKSIDDRKAAARNLAKVALDADFEHCEMEGSPFRRG